MLGGNVEPVIDGDDHREICLILGRGSGKDTLVSFIAAYESCLTDWTPYIRAGEFAWTFVIATREQQAVEIGKNMIFANIENSPKLRSLIITDEERKADMTMPRSKAGVMLLRSQCAITALPCTSKAGKGYPVGIAILDEAAFYNKDNENKNTDYEVYRSIVPRQIQFGDAAKRFIISSPGDKRGLVWERWRDRKKKQHLYFCIKAPTHRIRTDWPKEEFDRYKKLDPIGFRREYGAEFVDTLSPLLKLKQIMKVVRDDDDPVPYNPDFPYAIAIDAAFGDRDKFAVAVGHVEDVDGGESYKIVIDVAEAIEGGIERDVHDDAVDRVEELYKTYDCFEVIADQYQADAFQKTLEARGLNMDMRPWTAGRHRSCYGKLRACIKRGVISLPNNSDMLEELTNLQVKYLASGQYTISHKQGQHDDISDAVASVVDELYQEDYATAGVQIVQY